MSKFPRDLLDEEGDVKVGSLFADVTSCDVDGRDDHTVAASLDGALLRQGSAFPYYMLVAFEAGGFLRAIVLLLAAPLAWLVHGLLGEAAGIRVLIFFSVAGLKISEIQSVGRAVLPKFFCEDIHPDAWGVFSAFGKRILLTSIPRIMVETFAREFLRVDDVIGTELQITSGGRATGFVLKSGVLLGDRRASALREATGVRQPDVGVGSRDSDRHFLSLSKEGYIVSAAKVDCFPKDKLPKVIMFHDGRFVRYPTPMVTLLTLLWIPIGFFMAVLRVSMGVLPFPMALAAIRVLGVRVRVKGVPPSAAKSNKSGVLFVCNHRTLLDPVFLSLALGRRVPALTYSISRISELLSPIKTVRMERDRERDARLIKKLLAVGDLCVCPEGTTCREPFLLRFSAMFAELTNEIVPVAVDTKQSMFHGSTANGWKAMDLFFFFMNPMPIYEVTFLNQVPPQLTQGGGKSSQEVANYIQRGIAGILNFGCTNFTRKDKYGVLAGTDGTVPSGTALRTVPSMTVPSS